MGFMEKILYAYLFLYFMFIAFICMIEHRFNKEKTWKCIEEEFQFWEMTCRD